MNLIEKNRKKIIELCKRHKVATLFAFGSILTNQFKSDSDIDLIVEFDEVDLFSYADNYFDLKFSLENLLQREVDLLEDKAIINPYLRQSIDATKKMIYGQRHQNLAV